MPIIPIYQVPGGVPTPGFEPAPPVEDYPAYRSAQLGNAVSKIGSEVENVAVRQMRIKGAQNADNLRMKASIDLDAGFKQILEAGPKQKTENLDVEGGMSAGEAPSGDLGLTTTVTPQSETIVEDTKALVDRVRKQYGSNVDGFTARHLNPHLDLLETTYVKQAQAHQFALRGSEAEARTLDYINSQTKLLMTQPLPAVRDVNGTSVLDPSDYTAWVLARKEIGAKIDADVKVGALRGGPAAAERWKEKAFNHLDHEAAQHQMIDNPAAWNDSVFSKTNGWVGKLTGEQMEKLNTRATALVNGQDRKDEMLRKRDAAAIEKNFRRRTSEEGDEWTKNPLSELEVIENSETLGDSRTDFWTNLVRNRKNGAWGDTPDVVRPLAEEAMNPARASQQTINRIQAATRPGGFSVATADRYITHATSIIQAREGKDERWNFHDYGATHAQILTDTSTPSILGGALDTQANGTRMDATRKLMDYAQQEHAAGRTPDYGTFYRKVLQPEIVRGMGNLYSGHATNLSKGLTLEPAVDLKTGIPTTEGITASAAAAYRRWGVNPESMLTQTPGSVRLVVVPDGLKRELRALKQIEEISDSRRALLRQQP